VDDCHVDTSVHHDLVKAVLLREQKVGDLHVLFTPKVRRKKLRLHCVDPLEVIVV
jgi:hypothetical protein